MKKSTQYILPVSYTHLDVYKRQIEKCLIVLAQGKAEEIEKIFKVLNENGISKKAIENCLYVLARGKAREIEKIFKVLDENDISKKTIENCLSVLVQGKAGEIEKIFKVLNENEILKKAIETQRLHVYILERDIAEDTQVVGTDQRLSLIHI